jgi:hypothetical protein
MTQSIDDVSITCEVPKKAPPGSNINITWLSTLTELCKILSSVLTFISSLQNCPLGSSDILLSIEKLNARLDKWKEECPILFRPDSPINLSRLTTVSETAAILCIRYNYFGTLLALHSPFMHPWRLTSLKGDSSKSFDNQIRQSTEISVEAARSIILHTMFIEIDYACPSW